MKIGNNLAEPTFTPYIRGGQRPMLWYIPGLLGDGNTQAGPMLPYWHEYADVTFVGFRDPRQMSWRTKYDQKLLEMLLFERVLAWCDAHNDQRAILYGGSMGGRAAIRVARQLRQEGVTNVHVILHATPAGWWDVRDKAAPFAYLLPIGPIGGLFGRDVFKGYPGMFWQSQLWELLRPLDFRYRALSGSKVAYIWSPNDEVVKAGPEQFTMLTTPDKFRSIEVAGGAGRHLSFEADPAPNAAASIEAIRWVLK